MTVKYATPIKRMTEEQKVTAQYEAEVFARDCDYAIMAMERDKCSGEYWAEVFSYTEVGYATDDERRAAVDIVRCPNCNEIQACWGQFGDPESEVLVCSQCHKEYEYEPF